MRLNAHARGDVKPVTGGQCLREELSRHHLEAAKRRASHAQAERPERPPLAVFRSLSVQPAPVETHVVVEALRL